MFFQKIKKELYHKHQFGTNVHNSIFKSLAYRVEKFLKTNEFHSLILKCLTQWIFINSNWQLFVEILTYSVVSASIAFEMILFCGICDHHFLCSPCFHSHSCSMKSARKKTVMNCRSETFAFVFCEWSWDLYAASGDGVPETKLRRIQTWGLPQKLMSSCSTFQHTTFSPIRCPFGHQLVSRCEHFSRKYNKNWKNNLK